MKFKGKTASGINEEKSGYLDSLKSVKQPK